MGIAEQRLANAVALLKGTRASLSARFGAEYLRHAEAAAVVGDHYREQRQKETAMATTTHTFDTGTTYDPDAAAPSRRVHIHVHTADRDEDIEAGEKGINPAQESKGRVGAELVQRLPGPVSAYFIAADGAGRACIYRSSDVDGELDPGVGNGTGNRLTGDQKKLAAVAKQRDAARSRSLLAHINEANRKMWGSAA